MSSARLLRKKRVDYTEASSQSSSSEEDSIQRYQPLFSAAEKLARRKQQNRNAAANSRDKKKQKMEEAYEQIDQLKSELTKAQTKITELSSQVTSLNVEVNRLTQLSNNSCNSFFNQSKPLSPTSFLAIQPHSPISLPVKTEDAESDIACARNASAFTYA